MKNKFLDNEFWYLSLAGAFLRNRVYSKEIIATADNNKEVFRKKLKCTIIEIVKQYHVLVTDKEHVANINYIIDNNENEILINGKLKFGTVQKMLNLYLKYMWCADKLSHIPPHCPVDSIILSKSKKFKNDRWTHLDCSEKYMGYIHELRELAKTENLHLAEWELEHFSSRTSS